MKRIEILYFEGCPNHRPAVEMAREVIEELGIDAQVHETQVPTPEDAARLKFLGSPSIRIDGVDIEPSARERTDVGFSCRTYAGAGLPSKALLAAALRGDADAGHGAGPGGAQTPGEECCGDGGESGTSPTVAGRSARRQSAPLAAFGAFAAAGIASACCWLPLGLIAFGASAGGIGAVFEQTRPIFLGLAAILLSFGFYSVYFRTADCAPGTACAAPNARLRRFNKLTLWLATAGTIAFAAFPIYVGAFLAHPADASIKNPVPAVETVELHIAGMSCRGCVVALESELAEVAGVFTARVDYDAKIAVVEVGVPFTGTDSLVSAVQRAGFSASSLSRRETS